MNAAELGRMEIRVDRGREFIKKIAELEDKRQKVEEGGEYLEVEFKTSGRFCLATQPAEDEGFRIKQFQGAICRVLNVWIGDLKAELEDL